MNDTLRIPRTLATRLERVAAIEGQTATSVAREAIAGHLQYLEWKTRAIAEGEADIRAGRVMTTAEVSAALRKQRARRAGKKA
ncbi:MAG: CopG family ribbon-helix-helix protein [Burkholderiales bacterium]